MSTENWKLESALCRCCHAEGSFENLGVSTLYRGVEEVYSDMLRDSLDITLTPVSGPLCELTYTICKSCIQKLRDASNFKKQVLVCEQRFIDLYSRNVIKVLGPELEAVVKEEVPGTEGLKEEDTHIDDYDDGFDGKFADEGDDEKDLDVDIKSENDMKKNKRKGKSKSKSTGKEKKVCRKVGRPRKIKKEGEDAEDKQSKGCLVPEHFSEMDDGFAKKYKCVQCDALVANIPKMKQHLFLIHQNMRFKCPLCAEQFKYTDAKKRHLLISHGMEEVGRGHTKKLRPARNYICDICKREFLNRSGLIGHISNTHTLIKCPDCLDSFTKRKLPFHRHKVHDVPIPTCGVCGYKNRMKCNIVLHQRRVHLKEKNVSCEHCSLKFFNTQGLKKHSVKHESERKFPCEYCNKKFARKWNLKLHEKIHKGEKNKACSLCSEKFVQKASLNYHMMKYHPEAC